MRSISCHLHSIPPLDTSIDHSSPYQRSAQLQLLLGMSAAAAIASPIPAAIAVVQQQRRGRSRGGGSGAAAVRCSAVAPTSAIAPILADLRLRCAAPLPLLRRVVDAMASGMRAGLADDGAGELKMIPSHVYSLPTG